MRERNLGRTGIRTSEYGYGAWSLGGEGPVMGYGAVAETDALDVLRAYVDLGGNFIDTARAYNDCERVIGLFLGELRNRERMIITTKTISGQSAESIPAIRKDLEESLRQMRTEYVDVLLLHQPPEDHDTIHRALDELLLLKEEGKIRATGASIKGPDVTGKTESLCRLYLKTGKCEVIELVYSILRQKHRRVIEEASDEGVGIIVRTSLESGLLTGKYLPGHAFVGQDQRSRYGEDRLALVLKTVQEMQRTVVCPPYTALTEIAIKFALSLEGVSSVIVGARNRAQLEGNTRAARLPDLDRALVRFLEERYGHMTEQANYS